MKKLLSLLSVLTISETAMPNVIAASNYQLNHLDFVDNWEKIKKQKMEIELNNYHKLNNEQQELLKYLIENKENIISKIGEKEFKKN